MAASWRLTAWLAFVAIVTEAAAALVMYMLSSLYLSVTTNNRRSFWENIAFTFAVVSIQAIFHSYKVYLGDKCSIYWRKALVDHLQANVPALYDRPVPNTDQRITQDVDMLCSELYQLVERTIVLPVSIAFYSVYLVMHFGLIPWLCCILYFVMGAAISSAFATRIVQLVYQQGQFEGDFRLLHSHFMTHKLLIQLLGGGVPEQANLKQAFNMIIWNRQSIILHTLYLNVCTNWFAYAGAIASYLIIGVALLYPVQLNQWSLFGFIGVDLTSDDRIVLLSRGSFACMNLIFAFTSGLTAYSVYVNFQGHMHRVQDIFPGLSVLQLLLFSPAPSSPNPCARCCSMLPTTQYQPVGHDDDDSGLEEGLLLSQYTHAGRNQEDLRMTTATMPMERQMLLTLRNFSLKLRGTHGNHRCLVDKLNLSISCNMRLLITGKTGAGKSQLLHYIAHLFRIGQQAPSTAAIHAVDGCGADNHPTDKIMAEYEYAQVDRELGKEDVYVCPQAAYNQMQESVWEYLHYPRTADKAAVSAEHKSMVIRSLQLCDLLEKFNTGRTINDDRTATDDIVYNLHATQVPRLSLGEKQSLSIARYLFNAFCCPQNRAINVVLLDEATSAVDEETEQLLYQAISAHCKTFISVGHRSTIRNFHTHELHIGQYGCCTVTAISGSASV